MRAHPRAVLALVLVGLLRPGLSLPWTPPIGLPDPGWGIDTPVAPARPLPWTAEVTGFYYVDDDHVAATDTANPYGYPGKPRLTIPNTLAAGSYVEVNGTYNRSHTSPNNLQLNGTVANPIFIRSQTCTPPYAVVQGSNWETSGSYYVLECLDFHWTGTAKGAMAIGPQGNVYHAAVRNCVNRGNLSGGGMSVSANAGFHAQNVVIYNCEVKDSGDYRILTDQDVSGIVISARASHVYIMDNTIARSSGDGVSINATSAALQQDTHHVYVGRNVSTQNKQTGFWTKQAEDVIYSQNTAYHLVVSASSPGACLGGQYAPSHVWVIFNHFYDCDNGIKFQSDSGLGYGTHLYIVGNLIHHIQSSDAFDPANPSDDACISLRGMTHIRIVNNTCWHYAVGGIMSPNGAGYIHITGNILGARQNASARDILLQVSAVASASDMTYNNLDTSVRIEWPQPTLYTSLAAFQSGTGKGQSSLSAAPQFLDAGARIYHLTTSSPGYNAGPAGHEVYDTFLARYGRSIAVDFDGASRPLGAAWDIGAFELAAGGSPRPPVADRPAAPARPPVADRPAVADRPP